MVDFILQTFPEYQASPSHPSSRSFDLSATTDVAEVIPPQERFVRRIKDGKACHALLHTLNKFERVSDSPTQGKELKANPDILDLLRNKVPDSRYVPLSFKDSAALERSMRSMLETHSFLTWSVMAFIRSLHDRNLLPKDDQIISELQKSFSKACGNLTSGLSSSAAFVTLKRRQLLFSHVVPSVSDAQKRNLLSDPFFQTGSLFSSSSVETARSAARELSLFTPHLKSSSSATPSRRSGYSGSAAPRAPSRPLSAYSSSQRSSSSHRPQLGKKGDSRFRKKSSRPHQKRVSFRRWEPCPSSAIGGCLANFWLAWRARGVDSWVVEVLRVGYQIPFDRRPPLSECPLSLPGYSPQSIRGVALNQELQNILQQGAVKPAPPVSWFLQPSVPRPEGFGVVASHHRTVDPERLRHLVSLPHGNSTVSPSLHPSRRLDDLPGPAGRLPAGSCSSRFASLPSIRGATFDSWCKDRHTSSGSFISV